MDNVALVDKYMGHVRKLLEDQHDWDDTTVVVMGDHSWRTKLVWMPDAHWSAEDQLASHGGQYDDRPYYAIKLPSQTTGARISTPFAAIHTRALLDALLRRDIGSPEQLERWVDQQGSQP